MATIREWLRSIGLEHHADRFEQNSIGCDILPDLTDEHLKELELPLGDRVRVLRALRQTSTTPQPDMRPGKEPPQKEQAEAERRLVSVLFCDLVGSTELSREMDPEDMRQLLQNYQDAVSGAIVRYNGYVAKFLGDGVLAYFGWPKAYEDQAERAVFAGLEAVAAVAALSPQIPGKPLQARAGIASGEVVIAELVSKAGRDAESIIGESPNLAARLQSAAGPGEVVVSDATRQLTGEVFRVSEIGSLSLKGFDPDARAWRVLGAEEPESRFLATRNAGLSPFVGRQHEMALLLDCWQRAKEGKGRLVMVSGEPGIGKSRLIQAFQESLDKGSYTRLFYQCSPYHGSSAFYPVARQLQHAANFKPDDNTDAMLDKLEILLERDDKPPSEVLALIANLLSLEYRSRYGEIDLTPPQRKEHLIAELMAQLDFLARQKPVILLLEDAHWIDPSTLEFLQRIVSRLEKKAVLVLITHRLEWTPPFGDESVATRLQLNRLATRQLDQIAGNILGSDERKILLADLVNRSDGNPLFAEEMAKMVLETQSEPGKPAVPVSLQALFLARLDRMGEAKAVAQFASVVGREFEHDLLEEITETPAANLDGALQSLVTSGLVRFIGEPPNVTYTFKHALAQEAIYNSLLKSKRREIHAKIAHRLNMRAQGGARIAPEILAQHFEEAADNEKAIRYWKKSAQNAAETSANMEAAAHCKRALQLIELVPPGSERDRLELELLILAGPQQMLSTGLVTPEAEAVYRRATELGENCGSAQQRFQAHWGLWHVNEFRAEWKTATSMAKSLTSIAAESGDDALRMQAHHAHWSAKIFIGDIAGTLAHSEKGLQIYRMEKHQNHAQTYGGHDPGVCAHQMRAAVLAITGNSQASRHEADAGLALADRLEQPASLSTMNFFSGVASGLNGRFEEALVHAEAAAEIGRKFNILPYEQMGRILLGWARVRNNEVAAGLSVLEELLNTARTKKRKRALMPSYLGLMADAYRIAGKIDEGIAAAMDGLERVELQDERLWESELLRILALLKFAGNRVDRNEAVDLLHRAYRTARKTGSNLFAIKAAAGLAEVLGGCRLDEKSHEVLTEAMELELEDSPSIEIARKRCLDAL